MKQLETSQLNAVKGGVGKRSQAHGKIFTVKVPTSTPQK